MTESSVKLKKLVNVHLQEIRDIGLDLEVGTDIEVDEEGVIAEVGAEVVTEGEDEVIVEVGVGVEIDTVEDGEVEVMIGGEEAEVDLMIEDDEVIAGVAVEAEAEVMTDEGVKNLNKPNSNTFETKFRLLLKIKS